MRQIDKHSFTLSINSYVRPLELDRTLGTVGDFPNIQVILNGARLDRYREVMERHGGNVRFIVNDKNIGIAASWNQGIVISDTRYVILSSDDLEFTPGWYEPLIDIMGRETPPLHVSLSDPMSFSCFCIDKELIARQGWFDHNFASAYFEDEDWCLRLYETLGYREPIPYDKLVPKLNTVRRHPHKRGTWNAVPNKAYFIWKWKKAEVGGSGIVHTRAQVPYRRRLPEPSWPLMDSARQAYAAGDSGEQEWVYSPPRPVIRFLSWITSNPLFTGLEFVRKRLRRAA